MALGLERIPISGTTCPISRTKAIYTKVKNPHYELAFHLNPNLEESKVSETKARLEQAITGRTGTISFSKEPEKIRLSYAIDHNNSAFFGYIQFTLGSPEEALKELNDELKLNNDILRYLIVKVPAAGQSRTAVLKHIKAKERVEKRPKVEAATPEQTKEMEKKLEDILGNL